MKTDSVSTSPKRIIAGEKLRGADKTSRIPIKVTAPERRLPKPNWIRAHFTGTAAVSELKTILRRRKLHTVCEEAACPNLGECFNNGTATFLIMGDICTRRCPFCDVAHGRPLALDQTEPQQLAQTIAEMGLNYVVITSVNRDDLRDGGADHFAECIKAIRQTCASTKIEILVPDFRGRQQRALDLLSVAPPDVFNHNLETIPRLYQKVRPGADYQISLELLEQARQIKTDMPTKSGLMLGLGETRDEVSAVLADLRRHRVELLTLGQYLQPSKHHLAVERYLTPQEFYSLKLTAQQMGFSNVAAAPMVRSSYHAEQLLGGGRQT